MPDTRVYPTPYTVRKYGISDGSGSSNPVELGDLTRVFHAIPVSVTSNGVRGFVVRVSTTIRFRVRCARRLIVGSGLSATTCRQGGACTVKRESERDRERKRECEGKSV